MDWEGEAPEISNKKLSSIKKPEKHVFRSGKKNNPSEKEAKNKLIIGLSDEEAESTSKILESEKISFSLFSLYETIKSNLLQKIENLQQTDSASGIYQSLLNLHQMIADTKDPTAFDLSLVLEKLIVLEDYSKKLSEIQNSLILSFPTENHFERAFKESASTANLFSSLLNSRNTNDSDLEIQRFKREFEAGSTRDKLAVIINMNSFLRGMINVQNTNLKDFDRQTHEITEKLSNSLKEMQQVIEESLQTLEKIEKYHKSNDDGTVIIRNAYNQRFKDIVHSIETLAPYTQTLPKAFKLLSDIEQFKRELIDERLSESLISTGDALQEMSKDLSQALNLQTTNIKGLSDASSNDFYSLVKVLETKGKITKALLKKLLGKKEITGLPEIDLINTMNLSDNSITIDVGNLLKTL